MSIQGDRCSICGCSLDKTTATRDDSFTVDHVTPKSRGGTEESQNKRPCCRRCNLLKGSLTWSIELDYLIATVRAVECETSIRVRGIDFIRNAKNNTRIFRIRVTKSENFEIRVRNNAIEFNAPDAKKQHALAFSSAMRRLSKQRSITEYSAAGVNFGPYTLVGSCAFCGKKVHGTPNTDCVIICKSCYTHLSQAASLCKKIYKAMSCTY